LAACARAVKQRAASPRLHILDQIVRLGRRFQVELEVMNAALTK
jgi:hypothetical protein